MIKIINQKIVLLFKMKIKKKKKKKMEDNEEKKKNNNLNYKIKNII